MIPWKISIYGIRDFPPTRLDLSGKKSHILITGLNGTGKSTITYCIGAVLNSAKVDLFGLKSSNLSFDQTWNAQISLLFKNDGRLKVDAPEFIEFTLKINQEPGQPIKKEFTISSGDYVSNWIETSKYTSGDPDYNFFAYLRALQYKYKVDPDLNYLIWYQEEVQQFLMDPVERFRIFSEMYGIDKLQSDLEESMEITKKTTESLCFLKQNINSTAFQLKLIKAELDRFMNNRKRINEGGKLCLNSLLELVINLKNEEKQLHSLEEQLKAKIEEMKNELTKKIELKETSEQSLLSLTEQLQQLEKEIVESEKEITEKKIKLNSTIVIVDSLEQELEEITRKKDLLTQTKEQVKFSLHQLSEELDEINEKITRNKSQLKQLLEAWQEKVELVELEQVINLDDKTQIKRIEHLSQYLNSQNVQRRMEELGKGIKKNKNQKWELTNKIKNHNKELRLIAEEPDYFARSLEAKKLFQLKNMRGYLLHELIELDETPQLKDEQLFNEIKYTIFFDGKTIQPPDDLYYVPLKKIIPHHLVTKIPQLHLRLREGLVDDVIPYAIKALYWVETTFKVNPSIVENGMFTDSLGFRGPKGKAVNRIIGNSHTVHKEKVEQIIVTLTNKLQIIEQKIVEDTNSLQELNRIVQLVRKPEEFLPKEYERVMRQRELSIEKEKLTREIKKYKELDNKLVAEKLIKENSQKDLQKEIEFYEELGKLKGKYEELSIKKEELTKLGQVVNKKQIRIETLQEQITSLEKMKKNNEKEIQKLEELVEGIEYRLHNLENEEKNHREKTNTIKYELVETFHELKELQQIIPEIYSEASSNFIVKQNLSVSQLREKLEKGRLLLNQALQEEGIDTNSLENFKAVNEEYNHLENEYKRSLNILVKETERTEQLQDQLETTINLRVIQLQQQFKNYMSLFQLEGDICWELSEDRNSPLFNLFIKARKKGHQRAFEDDSNEARGRKFGKGISGGEEAISYLLFALALLQNLQPKVSFIVLDEFDSALDEQQKQKIFDLYASELARKLIILTAQPCEGAYLDRFSKAFVFKHDPTIQRNEVFEVVTAEN